MRVALKSVLDAYPELEDGDFLFSRQVNFETIHTHDVSPSATARSASCARELERRHAPRAPHRAPGLAAA